jgi:hypothetical protein
MANNSVGDQNSLEQALEELSKLVQPEALTTMPINWLDHLPYLLLVWAYFYVFPLQPSDEQTGNAGGKVIPLANGRSIYDSGFFLSTSPGDDYDSYCTGKLLETTEAMIKILAERGITQVGFSGHAIAKRAAWMHCVEHHIEVTNFYPSAADWELLERIRQLRNKKHQQHIEETAERRPI